MTRVRLVIIPEAIDRPCIIDYNYQHSVASALFDLLRGTSYDDLHNKKSYKFFSFSRLYLDSLQTRKNGIEVLGGVTLWYSTPDDDLLDATISSLEETDSINIEGLPFRVLSVSKPFRYSNNRGEDTLISMSPVLVRSLVQKGEQTKQWEIAPDDDEYEEILVEKLKRKYSDFKNEDSDDLEVVSIWDVQRKMVRILDVWHRCYFYKIRLRGDPRLINFAYDCGLGEKNSMGFGMVRSALDGIPIQTLEHLKVTVK
ncbi:MAG: CRISPR-associated endoribonuclease Cas6 [Candidatus Thorarchaeota archaeon]|nr:MAG: CRISPR-associated endoribonuclease Cas6 [Candidatus Thorarchaeota archaeon]